MVVATVWIGALSTPTTADASARRALQIAAVTLPSAYLHTGQTARKTRVHPELRPTRRPGLLRLEGAPIAGSRVSSHGKRFQRDEVRYHVGLHDRGRGHSRHDPRGTSGRSALPALSPRGRALPATRSSQVIKPQLGPPSQSLCRYPTFSTRVVACPPVSPSASPRLSIL